MKAEQENLRLANVQSTETPANDENTKLVASQPVETGSDESYYKNYIKQVESHGDYNAVNSSSGCWGAWQLSPSFPYTSDPAQQDAMADNYVKHRYGSWQAAYEFHLANGWY